jgi:hypothetical protein
MLTPEHKLAAFPNRGLARRISSPIPGDIRSSLRDWDRSDPEPKEPIGYIWKDNYRKDAGAATKKKEVKNLIARTHYLQLIIEADDLLAYVAGERIRHVRLDFLNALISAFPAS